MIRRPYRTAARFYDDQEQPGEVVWYVARDDAELLGGDGSAVCSLDWSGGNDDWIPQTVGEVPFADRVYTGQWTIPTALGQRVCGTVADFAGDGVRDQEQPPEARRPDGLPVCCGWVVAGEGGIGLGGSAPPIYVPPGPVVLPGGPTCGTAALVVTGVTYQWTIPPAGIDPVIGWWRLTDYVSGAPLHLVIDSIFASGLVIFSFTDSACRSPTGGDEIFDPCTDLNVSGAQCWVGVSWFTTTSSVDVVFRFEPGACP